MNRLLVLVLAYVYLAFVPNSPGEATADIVEFTSTNLQSNPLGDPAIRRALVCAPNTLASNTPAPIVYYLPGFGKSAEKFIKNKAMWQVFTDKVSREIKPMRLVIVDGHNHWGGSQYVNSSAQGNYADYICNELGPLIESRYAIPKTG